MGEPHHALPNGHDLPGSAMAAVITPSASA